MAARGSCRPRRRWQVVCRSLPDAGIDTAVGVDPGIDSTAAAGLELQVRSQWSYARMRFFRHRLAVAGLVGLIIIFGAGIFANFVAPYSYFGT